MLATPLCRITGCLVIAFGLRLAKGLRLQSGSHCVTLRMHRSGSPVIQFVYSRQYLIGILSGYLMAALLLHYQHPNCPVEKCPVGGKLIVSHIVKSSTLRLWSARWPVLIPREEDSKCHWHPNSRRIYNEAIYCQRAGDCERNSKWSDFHCVESPNWTKERQNSLLGCDDAK